MLHKNKKQPYFYNTTAFIACHLAAQLHELEAAAPLSSLLPCHASIVAHTNVLWCLMLLVFSASYLFSSLSVSPWASHCLDA